jgi:branched-chain amino acid transport system ATP-binding protein
MTKIALECRDVTVSFGALKAIDGFNHQFEAGRNYGLIGPNGAGKTTLLNVLAGRLFQSEGTVLCNGTDISAMPAYKRARAGIGRSFQITKTYPEMTVAENLRIAAQIKRSRFLPFWVSTRYDRQLQHDIDAMLELTGLVAYRDEIAGTMSYGLQRALELGVTLLPQPTILLLDEPLAGIGHHEIDSATRLIRSASEGRTVLLIEHNMDAVMSLSDEIVVMSNGRKIACGVPQVIRADQTVRSVYLGEEAPA